MTVTGTNGKTTVTNLIADALAFSGREVLTNRLGSNTDTGVASALLSGLTLLNRQRCTDAVLEVDERSSIRVYPHILPDFTVIVNLSRDSIMRNAFPEYISELLTRFIPASAKLILNADDLISCRVALGNSRVYFSLAESPGDWGEGLVNDLPLCPRCSAPLVYTRVRRGHIGRARCPECGLASPEGDFSAVVENGVLAVTESGGTYEYPLPPHVDPYDLLAAVALLRARGLSPDLIARALAHTGLPATRRSEARVGDVTIVARMAKDKNAVACTGTFEELRREPGEKELLLMMSCLYDQRHWSENTCWLYDCDFELLADPSFTHIVAAGPRCLDYRLRLMLAGVPEERISWEPDEKKAARLLRFSPGTSVYILYGTDFVRLARRVWRYAVKRAGRRRR